MAAKKTLPTKKKHDISTRRHCYIAGARGREKAEIKYGIRKPTHEKTDIPVIIRKTEDLMKSLMAIPAAIAATLPKKKQ